MSFKLPLTNLQNVVPGNTATLEIPAGPGAPTYDQIKLVLSGGMLPAHIEQVRGKADGRIFLDEITGTVVSKRDDFKGIFTEATVVALDFTEKNTRNGATEQLLASVPGSLVKKLTLEIKIAAAAPANGRIKAVALYRPPTSNPYIRKLLSISQSFVAAGTDANPNIIYLPVGAAGGKIKRIWIHEGAAGSITGTSVRIANNVIHEATRAETENEQKRNKLVPQAGIHVIDFIEDGNLAGLLDTSTAPSVELRLTTSAADNYQVFYELIDPIGRL
jgi:hypothetical protein